MSITVQILIASVLVAKAVIGFFRNHTLPMSRKGQEKWIARRIDRMHRKGAWRE